MNTEIAQDVIRGEARRGSVAGGQDQLPEWEFAGVTVWHHVADHAAATMATSGSAVCHRAARQLPKFAPTVW